MYKFELITRTSSTNNFNPYPNKITAELKLNSANEKLLHEIGSLKELQINKRIVVERVAIP